jgi:hypothetical protein
MMLNYFSRVFHQVIFPQLQYVGCVSQGSHEPMYNAQYFDNVSH